MGEDSDYQLLTPCTECPGGLAKYVLWHEGCTLDAYNKLPINGFHYLCSTCVMQGVVEVGDIIFPHTPEGWAEYYLTGRGIDEIPPV